MSNRTLLTTVAVALSSVALASRIPAVRRVIFA